MESIYIENYITMSQKQKQEFLNFIKNSSDFKIQDQKLIFSEESLLLEFFEKSNINKAYESFKDFFKNFAKIKVDIITEIASRSNYFILTFQNHRQLRIFKE